MKRNNLLLALGFSISAGALWIVLATADINSVARLLQSANPVLMATILGVVTLQVVLRAARWSQLLPTPRRTSMFRLLPPLMVGYLGNSVLPARLGEPIRAAIVARREALGLPEALGSVIIERAIDVATLALMTSGAAMIVGVSDVAQAMAMVAVAGGIAVLVFATVGVRPLVALLDRDGRQRLTRSRTIALRLSRALGGRGRRSVLLAGGLSLAAWLLDAASFWLAGHALGVELTYGAAMLVAGVTVLGTALPSAPGYVGTFELAAVGAAGLLGLPGDQALALAILTHVMTTLPIAAGGAIAGITLGATLTEVAQGPSGDIRSHA